MNWFFSQNQNGNESQKWQTSYHYQSYTTNCYDDPIDPQFMKCQKTSYDGQKQHKEEYKIPKRHSFRNLQQERNQHKLLPSFNEQANQLSQEFQKFNNMTTSFIHRMIPGFSKMFFSQLDQLEKEFPFMQNFNLPRPHYMHNPQNQPQFQEQRNQPNGDRYKNHYYFDSTKKDTNIRDL